MAETGRSGSSSPALPPHRLTPWMSATRGRRSCGSQRVHVQGRIGICFLHLEVPVGFHEDANMGNGFIGDYFSSI